MPPRRLFRRTLRGERRGHRLIQPLGISARRELRRANRLIEKGEHANAAVIFEQLANTARDLGLSRRAAHLYLQAGRAQALSGDPKAAQPLLIRGLELLSQSQGAAALNASGLILLDELRSLGYDDLTKQIGDWLSQRGVTLPVEQGEAARDSIRQPMGGRLPLICPQCGAPLRPGEVEWLDDHTATCPYCGSPVQEES